MVFNTKLSLQVVPATPSKRVCKVTCQPHLEAATIRNFVRVILRHNGGHKLAVTVILAKLRPSKAKIKF
eukprot:1140066-Pelagomonas_calceolata.AAC.1